MTNHERPVDMVNIPVPCIGWLGKAFGHRFVARDGTALEPAACLRCGTPVGVTAMRATTTGRGDLGSLKEWTPRCGRTDVHDSHEWKSRYGGPYKCPGAPTTCPTCGGAGVVDTSPPGVETAPWLQTDTDCARCGGSGEIPEETP